MPRNNHPIKLKEPGLQVRLFQFFYLFGRRREINYAGNFITCLQNVLDATPTLGTRLGNGFYEPFLISVFVYLESQK
jgi:hypothetical protein